MTLVVVTGMRIVANLESMTEFGEYFFYNIINFIHICRCSNIRGIVEYIVCSSVVCSTSFYCSKSGKKEKREGKKSISPMIKCWEKEETLRHRF